MKPKLLLDFGFGGSSGGSNYCNIEGQIMNIKNKYISIIGAGESGVGAALLAKKMGADVFVTDFNLIKDQFRKELEENDISYEENGHTLDKIGKADLIIKSPGIPNNTPVIKFIKEIKNHSAI